MSLILYDKPAQSDARWLNLDHLARRWRRTKRAIGGYWTGTFEIHEGGITQWTEWYNAWMGNRLTEKVFGKTSWEGLIWQMDLVKNGVQYRRTLDPKLWHNRVKIKYTDRAGIAQDTGWSENTDSSAIYGEMEMVLSFGGLSSAGATALQSRILTQHAWPASRNAGGLTIGAPKSSGGADGLYITVAGFYSTLDWQYYEATQETTAASTVVSTLVGLSEFVTAHRIETNSLSITSEAHSVPQRLGDLLTKIIEQGGTGGTVYKGGVYADRNFIYEPAPTTVDYVYRDGVLYDEGSAIVTPELLDPGFYVRDANAPRGNQPPGSSNVWDDPQVSYCDEVEFEAPNILRLGFPGQEERTEVYLENARQQQEHFGGRIGGGHFFPEL